MIKINLATRKQSSMTSSAIEAKPANKFRPKFKFYFRDIDFKNIFGEAQDLPLKKLILLAIMMSGSWYLWGSYRESRIAEKDAEINKLKVQQTKINADLAKLKGLDAMKASMESDAAILRTKIDVITKLIDGRQDPPRTLLALANGVPKEVWLSDFSIKGDAVVLKGTSLDFDKVTEVYKNLQENVFFTDVRLVDAHELKDGTNSFAAFELATKRK